MTTSFTPTFERARNAPRSSVMRAMLDGVERDVTVAYRVGGMHAALGTLNARTRFRVTALCPLEAGPLAHVRVYDRDQPRGQIDASIGEVCSIARVIADDSDTARISASRAGALVYTASGAVWGVLLHYDLRLRMAAPKERAILEHLGRRFSALFPLEIGAPS